MTAIATYHYVRIFNSWVNAFDLKQKDDSYAESWLEKYINFSLGTVIPVVLLVVFLSTVNQIYLS